MNQIMLLTSTKSWDIPEIRLSPPVKRSTTRSPPSTWCDIPSSFRRGGFPPEIRDYFAPHSSESWRGWRAPCKGRRSTGRVVGLGWHKLRTPLARWRSSLLWRFLIARKCGGDLFRKSIVFVSICKYGLCKKKQFCDIKEKYVLFLHSCFFLIQQNTFCEIKPSFLDTWTCPKFLELSQKNFPLEFCYINSFITNFAIIIPNQQFSDIGEIVFCKTHYFYIYYLLCNFEKTICWKIKPNCWNICESSRRHLPCQFGDIIRTNINIIVNWS